MLKKHKGAHSELVACAWLLARDYEVYRNVSQHGLIDLVAIKGPITIYIDVKTVRPNANGHLRLTRPPIGLVYLFVHPNGACEAFPPEIVI